MEGEFSSEISDSLCVGQRRPSDTDERVMLFLLMKPGVHLTTDLINRVNASIRQKLSGRHVPSFVFETPEIPVSDDMLSLSLSPLQHENSLMHGNRPQ